MGPNDVLVMSNDRVSLKHIRISDKKTNKRPDVAAKSRIELID